MLNVERTAVELISAIRTVIFAPVTTLRQWNTRPISTRELITAALVIWSRSRRTLIYSQHSKHVYAECVAQISSVHVISSHLNSAKVHSVLTGQVATNTHPKQQQKLSLFFSVCLLSISYVVIRAMLPNANKWMDDG